MNHMRRQLGAALCGITALGLALYAGCGGKSSGPEEPIKSGVGSVNSEIPQGPPPKQSDCDSGDEVSCVRLAQASCKDVWQLEYDSLPPMYVADNGLTRLDYFGLALMGTNAKEWFACLDRCPGTNVSNICVPIGFDLSFAMDDDAKCQRTDRDVHPWNGHPTKSLLIDCPQQQAEVTYVPDLVAVQRALVAGKAIKKTDVLAKLSGLIVKLSLAGESDVGLERVQKAHCSVFRIPSGYRVVSGAKAFETIRAMHPGLQAAFTNASNDLVRRKVAEARRIARKKIDTKLKKMCTDAGKDVSTEAKFRDCAQNIPGADAVETRIMTQETARIVQALTPKLESLLRRTYLEPVCKEFAK